MSKTKRKARPPQTNREALQRWGFAGAAHRGELPAYTAEHYNADVVAGVITEVVAGVITERPCPQDNPYTDCNPMKVPKHYRVTTVRITVEHNAKAPTYRARRWCTRHRTICYDCMTWLWWQQQGDLQSELGYRTSKAGDIAAELGERQAEELRSIIELTGAVELADVYLDYYETHIIAYQVKRCLGAWQAFSL